MKYFTIPVFVPELACPNRCVFCNQNSISGCAEQPGIVETENIILKRLKTISKVDSHIEIGFFGGNFTGIEESLQRRYLSVAKKFLESGLVNGIRCSTRPDYISIESLKLLKEYGVTTIELGAQSLDDEVLIQAGRGHTVKDVEYASGLIRKYGFSLGLQMMTGLPGDSPSKAIDTAKKIISLGADNTRIYPTLVIRDTKLQKLWEKGAYKPQTLEQAVELTATLLQIFNEANVKVIRVGLHPSGELIAGGELLAGPYHPNFRQLAESEVWRRKIEVKIKESGIEPESLPLSTLSFITVHVSEDDLEAAIGFQGSNKKMLEQYYNEVKFKLTEAYDISKPLIIAGKRLPLPSKNKLRNMGKVLFLEDQLTTYRSIADHPDIFICSGNNIVIAAPSLYSLVSKPLQNAGYNVFEGQSNPGAKYPFTAKYNAVITDKYLIHNLKITDPVVSGTFKDKEFIHVNQGYTRCNLLPLSEDAFITSDKGIEKVLLSKGFNVLYADPSPILLKGQKHGFFPGCCGIFENKVIINGNLEFHPSGQQIFDFIETSKLQVISLYNGPLRDIGSIFFFKMLQLNKLSSEINHYNSPILEVTNTLP